jgi:c-di-GMP-binding flagellar brake protein YcgR
MATSAPVTERRTHARMAANIVIRYGHGSELIEGELLDFAAGGIGIHGEKTYGVGTQLEVRFRSRGADKDVLTLSAVVRHSVPAKRMGLEFVNIRFSDVARTLAMIERLAAAQHATAPAPK